MGILKIISGDIIDNSKDVEAIVNPANKYMDYGCGVCGAIYESAGVFVSGEINNTGQMDKRYGSK